MMKASKCTCATLQEEFSAQKDLLSLQEREIDSLRDRYAKLEIAISGERRSMHQKMGEYQRLVDNSEMQMKAMLEQRVSLNDSYKQLQTECQQLEAHNLEMEEDLKYANKQIDSVLETKRENKKLKTQLLMLSDLYEGLTAKFNACKTNASQRELDALITEARIREMKDIKARLDSTATQLDAYRAKCAEIEAQMSKKNIIIVELRQTIENIKASHRSQIQVEKQRISAQQKVCQQLEQHIFRLYGQIEHYAQSVTQTSNVSTGDHLSTQLSNESNSANNSFQNSTNNESQEETDYDFQSHSVDDQNHYSNGIHKQTSL